MKPNEAIATVLGLLDAAGVQHMVPGGLIANHYGVPRSTNDADIGRETWIPRAEDLIIQKLRWFRDKDRDDLRNIIAVQGDALDFDLIHRWSDAHGTRGRLDEIRRSIPPI